MNQSLRDGFFGEDELSVHIGSNITLNTIAIVIGNTVSLIANDSAGSAGYVLTTSGNSIYWAAPSGGSGNGSIDLTAQYTWTNTHTFLLTVNGNITNANFALNANNASYLGTVAAASYQLNSTLAANVATLSANNASYLGGTVASSYQLISTLGTAVAALTANDSSNLGGVGAANYQLNSTLSANVAKLTSNATVFIGVGNTQLVSNSTGLWVIQSNIDHNSLSNFVANKHIDHSGVSISSGSGLTGGGDITATRTLSVIANSGLSANATGVYVVPNTGIISNTTGVFVNASYIATIAANSATFLVSAGITANTTTLLLANSIAILANGSVGSAGQLLTSNGTGIYWSSPGAASVNTAATYTWTNAHVFSANISVGNATVNIYSNGSVIQFNGGNTINNTNYTGQAASVANGGVSVGNTQLVSNSTGLWVAQGNINHDALTNFVANKHIDHTSVSISTGSGLTGGGDISATRTLSVIANSGLSANATGIYVVPQNGLSANTTGVYVVPGTGIVSNTTGVFVNASYIATISANSATFLVSAGITANSTALLLANSIAILANGSLGAAGQVLTSNSTGIYWSTVSSGGVNTAAAFTWTNTHTFQANVTITGNTTAVLSIGNSTINVFANSTIVQTSGLTLGYLELPINSQSAAYTTVLSDSGKTILHPSTDNNARTFTIANNSSVAYTIGTVLTFINAANTLTIAINNDTMNALGYTSNTGSRTLAPYGMATAVKIASTAWVISGINMT